MFSTYIPGGGITSLALDAAANNLLLSGSISLGQFPVATVATPITATMYQTLLRLPLDGSAVLASTLLAPGTQSFVAAGPSATAWVAGNLALPLLPLQPLSSIGGSFAVHINSAGTVDQTARFGGIAASNPDNAGAPVTLTSLAIDPTGNAIVAGSLAPYTSQSLMTSQTFDFPLTSATAAFPSAVRDAVLPASACTGSLCSGSAAWLAQLSTTTSALTASLAISVDDSPNLTLRNLGSAAATNLHIAVTGFTNATDCGISLATGADCTIAITGSGPGTITASAANAATQTQALPALTPATMPLAVAFSPRELDFGIVSSTSGPVTRTITVTNLTQQSQTFNSALDIGVHTTLPYTFAEITSDCALSGTLSNKLLAPFASCHITIGLSASNASSNDGAIQTNWLIGKRAVRMTAFAQAAALSLSASEIDFGTQYTNGLRLPRYLYLSNSSEVAVVHAAVTLPGTSPFSVTDRCPSLLEPLTVCQLQLAYLPSHTPSADSATLTLDQGLSALVTGKSLPQPSLNPNPSISVSATELNFVDAIPITSVSTNTQTLTLQNTGASPSQLQLVLSGDFAYTTNCGPTLAGGASCSIVFTFAPTQPGVRQGVFAVTAGAGTTPIYVTLSGTGSSIFSPANNGTLDLGGVILGQLSTRWYKITQPFTSFSAAIPSGSPFTAILVEDIGFGHGQPPSSAFTSSATGTCFNCWLGIEFTPPADGPVTGSVTLTTSTAGIPYLLALTGSGIALTGLSLTPVSQDFGPVPINSASGASLFTLTNLIPGGPVSVSAPTVTTDFAISNTTCVGPLAYTASCFVAITFAPTATGPRTGTLTLQAGGPSATATLTGYGSPDPGLSINPSALTFNNAPGSASTQQTIVVTNTSSAPEQVGLTNIAPASNFTASSNCGTLTPAATCSITVTFHPDTAPAIGTLTLSVTSNPSGTTVLTTYTVPLTGAYTADIAGLAIFPTDTQFGPQATYAPSPTHQFTIANLTAKSLDLSIGMPRQFALSGTPCTTLTPSGSCIFSVAFLPLANGDITGTITAQATPSDNSATLHGIGYVEGYGIGSASLVVSAPALTGGVLSFGQVPSGQSTQRTLTFTNTSATSPLTIRRVTSQWPFLSTTNCGSTLAPAANCTVLITYSPLNQVAANSGPPISATDFGTLVIESNAQSSPDLIQLSGFSTPVTVPSPSNAAPAAVLSASQFSLSFADTTPGSASTPQTVAITNTGTAILNISGIQSTSDFTVVTTCSTLLPGASCPLTVTFTPQTTQPNSTLRIAAIEITSNATTSLEFISLAGVSSTSNLSVIPGALNFGELIVGTSTSQLVELSNTGTSPATITSITATGDYTVTSATCPAPGQTLAAAATCDAQVTFSPTQPGTRAGTLSIASPAATAPLAVALNGSGIQSHMQVSPTSLNFGPIAVGSSTSLSLTISNGGTTPITGIILFITGDYAINQTCAVTLAPGASCPITLTFTPTVSGARPGTLTITSSDVSSPLAIPLTGSGIQSHMRVSPTSLSFGPIAVGSPTSLSLTISNSGTAPITAMALSTTGDYAITQSCAATLAPGASCPITVSFRPTASAARPGTLIITNSDASSPLTVPLTGSGSPGGSFTFTASGSSVASATVTNGTSAAFNLTLTPLNAFAGTVVLSCTPVVTATYASCSLLPSSITLASSPQNTVATISTVTSIAAVAPPQRTFGNAALCLLVPCLIFTWKARKSRRRAWSNLGLTAWAIVSSITLLSAAGCGGNTITQSNLRYSPAGTYQYQVTASSTTGAAAAQTVTLNLTVK